MDSTLYATRSSLWLQFVSGEWRSVILACQLAGRQRRLGEKSQPLQMLIDQSGLSITVGTLVTASAFGALLGFTVGGIVTHAISSRIAGACLFGIRAEMPRPGAPELTELELYLAWRAQGLPLEAPGVRR